MEQRGAGTAGNGKTRTTNQTGLIIPHLLPQIRMRIPPPVLLKPPSHWFKGNTWPLDEEEEDSRPAHDLDLDTGALTSDCSRAHAPALLWPGAKRTEQISNKNELHWGTNSEEATFWGAAPFRRASTAALKQFLKTALSGCAKSRKTLHDRAAFGPKFVMSRKTWPPLRHAATVSEHGQGRLLKRDRDKAHLNPKFATVHKIPVE